MVPLQVWPMVNSNNLYIGTAIRGALYLLCYLYVTFLLTPIAAYHRPKLERAHKAWPNLFCSFLCSAVLGFLCKDGNLFFISAIKSLGNFLIFLLLILLYVVLSPLLFIYKLGQALWARSNFGLWYAAIGVVKMLHTDNKVNTESL